MTLEVFMQFVITAYDGTDEDVLARRMSVRPLHLANLEKVKETGSVVCAGGIIRDGHPVGSVLVMEFESREKLDEYLANEPYVINNVWQDITVENMNVVIVNDEMVGK